MAKTPEVNIKNDYQRNFIINGSFDFWQRAVTFSALTGGNYTADRFIYNKSGVGVVNVNRSILSPDPAYSFSLLIEPSTVDTSIAATDFYVLEHLLEGYDFAPLSGKTFTLSFWVRSSKTGVHCVGFRNAAKDRSYVAEYTVSAIDTWEKKTITVKHDPSGSWNYDSTNGLQITWVLACGSDFQAPSANSWQNGNFVSTANQVNLMDSTANDFRIAQIQLLEGAEDLPFRRAGQSIGGELELCKRYYEIMSYGTDGPICAAAIQSSSSIQGVLTFSEKRAIPTLTSSMGVSNGLRLKLANVETTLPNTITFSDTTRKTSLITHTGVHGAGSNGLSGHLKAETASDGRIFIDAEII